MSRIFEPVDLVCPDCGETWQGIGLWEGGDVSCNQCGARKYADRLAQASAGRTFSVESIGGACPTQAQGRTADGRPYYFRARHGDWTLRLGAASDADGVGGEVVAAGDDDSAGWMEDDEVLAILDKHLGGTK